MTFSERAVDACARAMRDGTVTARHVNDVLRCKFIDVSPIAPFLESEADMVRKLAATIIGEKRGPTGPLVEAVLRETDKAVLLEMLTQMGKHGDAVVEVANMIRSDDAAVRDVAIDMFRRAGRQDCLLPLLFDRDDDVVERIKRYINEQSER